MRKLFFLLCSIALAMLVLDGTEANAKRRRGPASKKFRTIDGKNNNLRHSSWGKAESTLKRQGQANYVDGVSEVNDANLPNPRTISNTIASQSGDILNSSNLSDMLWQWGQFLDHDIDLTTEAEPVEELPIAIPTGDPSFDPLGTGEATLSFSRSNFVIKTPRRSRRSRRRNDRRNSSNPRQQINSITAYIDASNVYGSDRERVMELRTLEGGKLKVSEGNLLPFNTTGLENAGGADNPSLYLAGDIRANENVGLLSMHTLFVREHNRRADEIAAANPDLNDEQIYQRARKYVGALMQVVTYNEFIPALLGANALAPYNGYKPRVDAGIRNSFSTAAFRFGHSVISPQILRLDNDGNVIPEGNLALRNAFFRPDQINSEDDIAPLLKGLASQQMQEIDNKVIDDLRNFLFGAPGSGGLDLASLNIQRGRDHGLPSYNQTRTDYGLAAVSSFAEISSDPEVAASLETLYGDVNSIDPWVGMLAEDHLSGSNVGELMHSILKFQFEHLRDGDRYWYQRTFRGAALAELESTTLADIIQRNTELKSLQSNVFFVN